jgi:hypothetical protein
VWLSDDHEWKEHLSQRKKEGLSKFDSVKVKVDLEQQVSKVKEFSIDIQVGNIIGNLLQWHA